MASRNPTGPRKKDERAAPCNVGPPKNRILEKEKREEIERKKFHHGPQVCKCAITIKETKTKTKLYRN